IGASEDTAAPGTPTWRTNLGIASQTIQIDLTTAPGGLTQFASLSEAQNISANGTPFGVLADVQIDKSGYVTAIYENGTTRRLAQVAIATFSNPDALISQNGNAYQVSQESGTYTLKAPGAGGAGEIDPSTLEASTVDLSTEFTGLITTQRAYSAASKIITTADEMLEQLLNIKR
ncbi:MAG: flagellar hook-basal body complex protein, partial [Caulobacter sp.]